MGNSLGAMVFIVGGVALGYWVFTGRAQNFLYALSHGTGTPGTPQQQGGLQSDPGQPGTGSAGGWGTQQSGVQNGLHLPGAFGVGA